MCHNGLLQVRHFRFRICENSFMYCISIAYIVYNLIEFSLATGYVNVMNKGFHN